MTYEYPGMPKDENWRDSLSGIFTDGKEGFDRRLVDDFAALGLRIVQAVDIRKHKSLPEAAFPIIIDWLNNLDERIPGEETRHRSGIRISLIKALDYPEMKGNRDAINALLRQMDRTSPPLEDHVKIWTLGILNKIATKADYDRMLAFTRRSDLDTGQRSALVRYLGKFKRDESRAVARDYLQYEFVNQEAIRALGKIGTAEDIDAVKAFTHDENPRVRRAAETALKRLTA